MHVKILSADLRGIEAYVVEVEVDVAAGLPGYHLVGLPATAVTEGKVRIRSALLNSGFELPARKITVNLAPAEMRKDTSAFDLPVALAVLGGLDQLPQDRLSGLMALGELSLDGGLRPVRGALSVAMCASNQGVRRLIVPPPNGSEAALVNGLDVRVAGHLAEVVGHLRNGNDLVRPEPSAPGRQPSPALDLSDIQGQQTARRALELTAAGGHHLLMVGPPGSGKSMLAHRLAGILPPMTLRESLECTRVYSVAGLAADRGLIQVRPFRSPHHTVSEAGMVGGGSWPRPGELSLAHNGVLFLDELLEFRRPVLESLRQPLESGEMIVTRARSSIRFPADVMLVAAMNPCPCGYLGDPDRTCVCGVRQVARYRGRLSGPLMDRIDLHVEVPRLRYEELAASGAVESSKRVRARVVDARRVQRERFAVDPAALGVRCNAQMGFEQLRTYCSLDRPTGRMLKGAAERLHLSARAVHRVLKVARTVADLACSENIRRSHVAEALRYRALDWDHG